MAFSEEKQSSYTPQKAKQIKKYQKKLQTFRKGFHKCMVLFAQADDSIPKHIKERWMDGLDEDVFEIVMEWLDGNV